MFDTIIIGAGPSGMSAALNLLRGGKKVLILEKETFGGQIATSPRLENYPSIKEISGVDFANNLFEQIISLGVEFELETVTKLEKVNELFKVTTNYNNYESKTVIIATGATHRKMDLPKEEELTGHGVSYCATCDGAFYKDQDVVLIGDANTALQYALLLSTYCKSVKICTLFDKWFADNYLVKQLDTKKNISYQHNLSLVSFNGEKELESLTFKDTKTNEEIVIKCNGVFIAIGQIPNNEIFSELVTLDKGYIVTNEELETKTLGLYAIGDGRKKEVRQVATAISDGSIAAYYIIKKSL